MYTLAGYFLIIAFVYSLVGFGGGSSYTALLAVSAASYKLIPKISLICNILVVSSGCYFYWKKGFLNLQKAGPFILSSVPMAFLGGSYYVKEKTFMILLSMTLFLAGLRILFIKENEVENITPPPLLACLVTGGLLGLLSGIVGIGGGIFLSPFLLNFRWARAKEAAAIASLFIFINSIAGFIGQMTKGLVLAEVSDYWPLFVAVLLGGQIGSRMGTYHKISHIFVQRATGYLILAISVKLFMKW